MLLAGGMILGGSMPAFAETPPGGNEVLGSYPDGIIFGNAAPPEVEVALEVTGWPTGNILAGETITLSFHVDPAVLGAPTLEGALVGIGVAGHLHGFAALDETNTAELQVRPLTTGPIEFTPFFAGDADGVFEQVTADQHTVTVDEVPVMLEAWFSGEEAGEVAAAGGGILDANARVTPSCVNDDDEAVTALCYATYGVPAGTIVVMHGTETLAEVSVPGSEPEASFAEPGADVSEGTEADFVSVPVQLPGMTTGATETLDLNISFVPTNWFMSATDAPVTVTMNPAKLELSLFVGDDWNDQTTHRIIANEIPLSAYFAQSLDPVAPASGTVAFYVNGVAVSGNLPIGSGNPLVHMWQPVEGGTYEVTAAFTPDTFNHVGSVSAVHTVDVTIPPAPNPFPDGPEEDAAGTQTRGTNQLAVTGGGSRAWLGAAAASAMLLGAATLALRARTRSHG